MGTTAHHHDTTHGHGHGQALDGQALDGQAELLDLDAEVLAEHIASIVAWLPVGPGPRRIVDLGAGTGAGTLALLEHFPEADVTAVDSSVEHLQRLRDIKRRVDPAGIIRSNRPVLRGVED